MDICRQISLISRLKFVLMNRKKCKKWLNHHILSHATLVMYHVIVNDMECIPVLEL